MRATAEAAGQMARGKGDKKNGGDIIIRKEEVVEGGHHGGAWKVAYADFVTAMMAFFLLMWLLNATTEDQRKGLADYFSPNNLMSHASSGTGQPFGGHTAFDDGALVSDRGAVDVTMGKRPKVDVTDEGETEIASPAHGYRDDNADEQAAHKFDATGDAAADQTATATAQANAAAGQTGPAAEIAAMQAADGSRPPTEAEIRAQRERDERAAFDKAAQEIREAMQSDPALADLMKQLTIDMTPEGMRIQILDEDRQPMFTTGSAAPNDRARLLLQKITPVLMRLPEGISIAGHTDAAPFPGPGRTNWELSSERANMTRRLLVEAGLPETRIRTVTGHADRDPLLPKDPLAAANRRIAIVVLREAQRGAPPPPQPSVPAVRPQP
ncbi:MAG: flagellar motor protein MotB [Acetobacteraceae bacterium]|nr:flagellar motor protein MotB [Acetobacteraceae bacterium]